MAAAETGIRRRGCVSETYTALISRMYSLSDNRAYPTWPDCDPAEVDVIGRVVWAGRKIS